MIPRIAQRGYSFKGAGQYYLHDKGKDSSERVAWTLTHNVPTDDPELAMKWMAYTAMNSDQLKQQAGVSLSGRKSSNKPVYSFSIAWQPEQNPDPDHMKELAFDALEVLGLKDHEAVMVAHQDTAHPHVHVITNLVHPQTGKTLRPQNDRLRFSIWAEEYEKEHGKIYCEERVINNEKRRQGQKAKHRETKIDQALIMQNLYNQAQDAESFQKALEEKGWTLAQGDRRGFVLVNEAGKIVSLSRQLKSQRAKDIKERLGALENLPHGQTLSEDRKHFYRDQYETDFQKGIVDEAIKADDHEKWSTPSNDPIPLENPEISYAQELDKKRDQEFEQQKAKLEKEQKLRTFYRREKHLSKIEALQKLIEKERSSIKRQELERKLEDLKNTLSDIDRRMMEQGVDPISPEHGDFSLQNTAEQKEQPSPDQENSKEDKKLSDKEKIKKQYRDRNKDRGEDFGLDR